MELPVFQDLILIELPVFFEVLTLMELPPKPAPTYFR